MTRPLQTAVGEIPTAPLALVDVQSAEGVTGSSYVFCYSAAGLAAVTAALRALAPSLQGAALDPVPLWDTLRRRFTLLGTTGVIGLALGAIDMAVWDALAHAAGVPLARLLGGAAGARVPAYASLRSIAADAVAEETAEALPDGYRAFKVKLGAGDLASDLELLAVLRAAAGEGAALMGDYNQSLTLADARRRLQRLDAEQLAWIEEPIAADDIDGMARLTRATRTPIQAGESWWSPREGARSIAAGASDHVMPDVARIGGVTAWLRIAALAETAGLPISSHLYPEISAHLLAATPSAHLLEHLDLAGPLLEHPVTVRDGHVTVPDTPGTGIAWDEDAVSRFELGG